MKDKFEDKFEELKAKIQPYIDNWRWIVLAFLFLIMLHMLIKSKSSV